MLLSTRRSYNAFENMIIGQATIWEKINERWTCPPHPSLPRRALIGGFTVDIKYFTSILKANVTGLFNGNSSFSLFSNAQYTVLYSIWQNSVFRCSVHF